MDQGGLDIVRRHRKVERVILDSSFIHRLVHWRERIDANVLANLTRAYSRLQVAARIRSVTVSAFFRGHSPRDVGRKNWQNMVAFHLGADERDLVYRELRRHMGRFPSFSSLGAGWIAQSGPYAVLPNMSFLG